MTRLAQIFAAFFVGTTSISAQSIEIKIPKIDRGLETESLKITSKLIEQSSNLDATMTLSDSATSTLLSSCSVCEKQGPSSWATAENFFFFLKPSPIPVPIATTGPVAGRGILGNPVGSGRVILGNNGTDFDTVSGMRFGLGRWVKMSSSFGVEGSAFLLESEAERVTIAGGSNGLPVLSRPFFDTTIQANNARVLALPGSFIGSVATQATAQLWGAEAFGFYRARETCCCSIDAMLGFRFLSLEESFDIYDSSTVLANGITAFNGVGILAPATTFTNDHTSTQNRFYGTTIGLRAGYFHDTWSLGLCGKISLGNMHQTVSLDGTSTLYGTAPLPATVPGGLYNLSTNNGRFTRDEFAVVPEASVKFGYRIREQVTLTAGYDFLYLSRVVRPGDQIEQTVNPTFVPTNTNLGVPFGPRQPGAKFVQNDFWAHGASVGVLVTY